MPSRRIDNFPESRRGLGHVTLQFLAVRSAILATPWLLVRYWHYECDGGIVTVNLVLYDILLAFY